MIGPVILLSKVSFFAMNRTLRPFFLQERRQPGEGEIHVPGVVDRHHRPAFGRQVLNTHNRELQALNRPDGAGKPDHGSIDRLHVTSLALAVRLAHRIPV